MTDGLRDGARVAVTAGNPTAEEVAAVLAALDASRRMDEVSPRPEGTSAWLRAARREAVEGRLLAASPADLR